MLIYLIELRQRCLKTFGLFAFFFVIFFYFSTDLFTWITKPLANALPVANSFIATDITTAVFTPLKLASDLALILTLPFACCQIWSYIIPALYRQERVRFTFLITASLVLFGLGLVFCFYFILPFMFQFFVNALPMQVKMLPDMALALNFITRMLILFGLCFQLPILCWALVTFGWVSIEGLIKIRPYAIVSAFIIGMLLTPPDVFSQILLAVPLCLLYEFGIILCKLGSFEKKRLARPQK